MPLSLQPKLLRAIQQREIRALGSNVSQAINVRLIAATNQDLKKMVMEKRFREDLFYRLNVVNLELPALQERREDIPLLVRHFLEKMSARFQKPFKGLSDEAMHLLLSHSWPGNVRELENTMERAVALAEGEWVTPADLGLPAAFAESHSPMVNRFDFLRESSQSMTLEEMERAYILWVLQEVQNNRSLAARILGVDRKTLYNKLAEYKLSESA